MAQYISVSTCRGDRVCPAHELYEWIKNVSCILIKFSEPTGKLGHIDSEIQLGISTTGCPSSLIMRVHLWATPKNPP